LFPMTSPYRAMCEQLMELVEGKRYDGSAVVARARALLDQPEQVAPTVMEIIELHTWMEDEWRANNDGEDLPMVDYARAVLAKWGHLTPQPVAVSERLPRPEDCLDEGWAWFFNKRIGWRQAVLPVSPGYTHWLPANALPTPEDTNDC
jgi:hypothetical protein